MTPEGGGGGGGAVLKVVAGNEPRDVRRRRLRARRRIEKGGGCVERKKRLLGCGDSSSSSSSSSSPEDSLANEPVLLVAESEEAGGRGVLGGGDVPLHGAVSMIGRRREMEDVARVEVGFVTLGNGRVYDFYGVYDGHGGSRVAEFCGERLHRLFAEEIVSGGGGGDEEVHWERVMAESFAKVDEEVRVGGDELSTMGSTAVVAVVGADLVVVANCGDSRTVLCRNGVAAALSEDHKVSHAS